MSFARHASRMTIKQAALLGAVVVLLVVAVFLLKDGRSPGAVPKAASTESITVAATVKPPCTSVVNPKLAAPTDCIPQRMPHLPPDPGPEGMKTLLGVTTNPEGVRDDVYIRIWEKYGYSERAVRALLLVAKQHQAEVEMGDSVSVEVAQKFMRDVTMKTMACYMNSVDEETIAKGAHQDVAIMVKNTPERWSQAKKFARRLHGGGFELDTSPLIEQCGYDPAKLPD